MKKGNNSKIGNQIYFQIAEYVDLAVLIIFMRCQISDIINGFWVITQKPAILPYVLFLVTAQCWLVHGITGNIFETGHPNDDSDQVWFQFV